MRILPLFALVFPASRMFLSLAGIVFLTSCAVIEKRAEEKRLNAERSEALTTHAAWRAEPHWRSKTFRNEAILQKLTPENASVQIARNEQRGLLLVGGCVAMDFPVATGKKSHPTPVGDYKILGKQKDYSSNLYGKIVDPAGVVLVADADTRTDVPVEGASFVGARMPFWMRLNNSGVGMHVGYVPGRPASHGCIRLRRETAQFLFASLPIGTPVLVADHAPALDHSPTAGSLHPL